MHCFGPWPEDWQILQSKLEPSKSYGQVGLGLVALLALLSVVLCCCVAWWPITFRRTVGQSHSWLPCRHNAQFSERMRMSKGTEDAALHLTPMGTFWATLFFNIKCQINSEMWHRKISQGNYSVLPTLSPDVASNTCCGCFCWVCVRVAKGFRAGVSGSSNLGHKIMPNYKVKSFDRHTHTAGRPTPTPSVGVFIMGPGKWYPIFHCLFQKRKTFVSFLLRPIKAADVCENCGGVW